MKQLLSWNIYLSGEAEREGTGASACTTGKSHRPGLFSKSIHGHVDPSGGSASAVPVTAHTTGSPVARLCFPRSRGPSLLSFSTGSWSAAGAAGWDRGCPDPSRWMDGPGGAFPSHPCLLLPKPHPTLTAG